MRLDQLYAGSQVQPPGDSNNPNMREVAVSQSPMFATSVSWIGVLVALILLRVVYEVSE
jgi:hypothetical protein